MVKRFFFVLMLLALGITGAWADEVTEKQAQDLAKSFVNSYFGRKDGDRSGLKSQGQMEKLGFYVFNMTDKGGFVIVSNESETTPILGYSETGSIELDPDKMPENMRNWLQGYADEIAWWQQQDDYGKTETVNKARTRAGSHSRNTIPQLISTEWNQHKPYNLYCPLVDQNYNIVTGCVATAMAQVMYYTEMKAANEAGTTPVITSTTEAIPQYDWTVNVGSGTTTYHLGPIAKGSAINWSNMKNTYTGNESKTDPSADAVATLMQYCGYSVQMRYGSSSSAYISDVANALKSYFGYETTTQHYSRGFYSFDNWTDMIYNELVQGRPVLYGGQSKDNGHAFICDGYKYEDNTDLFHINWGWGGQSDGYFVLSVLNPQQQGAGGSPTNSAYTSDHEVVVGIQKIGGSGTVLEIQPNIFNLTLNSMTLSHSSVVWNTEVTATLNITNNNAIDYDGDIYIGYLEGNSWDFLVGDVFTIPARGTKDCVLKFKPQRIGTYKLVLVLPTKNSQYSSDRVVRATLPVVNPNFGIPTNLSVSNINSSGASLNWDDEGTANSWVVAYKTANANDFTEVSTSTKPYTFENLTSETEYTVKVRKSTTSNWSPEFTFTTTAKFPAPENLTVSEVTPTSAKISWTGSAACYDVRYGVLPNGLEAESKWLQYDDGNCSGGSGSGSDTNNTRTWGVLYPGTEVTGNKLTKVKFYVYRVAEITVNIYSGGDIPGTPIHTIVVTPQSTGFNELTLNSLPITPGENLWITLTESSDYPMALCNSNEPNNKWWYNGSWVKITDSKGWMIRGYIESDLNALDWSDNVKYNNSPYTLEGLDADKNYAVQVRSVYESNNSNNYSEWVMATISKALELGNEETKNATLIGSWNNYTTNVTLKDRTLYKDGSWNTLCLPFSLTEQQLAASPLAGADIRTLDNATFSEGILSLNFTENNNVTNITAGTPYIIKWTKANNYEQTNVQTRDIINPVFTGVGIDKTINDKVCDLGNGKSVAFKGAYSPIIYDQTNRSILFLGDNNKLYFPKSGAKINSCRAYFELTGFEMADVAQARIFVNDGNATGIISIDNENKIIVNETEGWYSLDGRKLSGKPSVKGVYIQGGKKVVIK